MSKKEKERAVPGEMLTKEFLSQFKIEVLRTEHTHPISETIFGQKRAFFSCFFCTQKFMMIYYGERCFIL